MLELADDDADKGGVGGVQGLVEMSVFS